MSWILTLACLVGTACNYDGVGAVACESGEVSEGRECVDGYWVSTGSVDLDMEVADLRDDEPDVRADLDEVDMGSDADLETSVDRVLVSPSEATLDLQETVSLTAQPVDESGVALDRDVEFSSSSEEVASVDSTGLVTAHSEGVAAITATSEGVEGTATITVEKKPVDSVDLVPDSMTIGVGDTDSFSVVVMDPDDNELFGREVDWSSGDEAVATVTDGLVTAVGVGTTEVVAAVEGVAGTAPVVVEPEPVNTVEVTPEMGEIEVAETVQLTGTAFDQMNNELVGRTITWMSDDTAVATVDSSGLVTGVGPGTATITGSSGSASDTANITVVPRPIDRIDIMPSSASLDMGEDVQLNATPRAADGSALTGRTIMWSSDNTPVATVDATGLVTAVSPGTAVVKAEAEGVEETVQITVNEQVDTVVVTPDPASVLVGETVQLNAEPLDSMNNPISGLAVTWLSIDPGLATVDMTGEVTGVSPGGVTIRASVQGVDGEATVEVLEPIDSVDLASTASGADIGETITFTATPLDDMDNPLSGRTCTYTSLDQSVATIDSMSGVATIVDEGDTSIEADCEGETATLAIAGYGAVDSVVVSPASATMKFNATQQFTVVLEDASGHVLSGRMVTWATSDDMVATVDNNGVASGRPPNTGTVMITATSEGVSDTASLVVEAP